MWLIICFTTSNRERQGGILSPILLSTDIADLSYYLKMTTVHDDAKMLSQMRLLYCRSNRLLTFSKFRVAFNNVYGKV